MMDPNFLHATLLSYQVSQKKREWHLEREMVVYKPVNTESRRSWAMAVRRWTGTTLVLLGERLRGTSAFAHPEGLADSVSTR